MTTTQDIKAPSGLSLIAGRQGDQHEGTRPVTAVNPASGEGLTPEFWPASSNEIEEAALGAAQAFDGYRHTTPADRATFLRTIASNLEAMRPELVARAMDETGLPEPRLQGELSRTTNQLNLFATEVELGEHQGVRVDHAQPDREPAPAPDLRQRQIPLGPVLVFGASNFPFAFSTAGGDTASALAAGCPVVVKAHNSHAGAAELAGHAITNAVRSCGLPGGVFSLVFGPGTSVGQQLAAHPAIKAIAFTGSQNGGTALMSTATQRPEPIPVYAEMSSINPVIVLPQAAEARVSEIVDGFVGSLTLGAGQFCTNPGLVFVPASKMDDFHDRLEARLAEQVGQTMLSQGIADAYAAGCARIEASGARRIANGSPGAGQNAPAPVVFALSGAEWAAEPSLQEEVFGAAALVVTYEAEAELRSALESLQGQLTITIHADHPDSTSVSGLLPILERKAGRLLMNDWPTGVEVNHTMVHGGPFPATSDSRTTSVGSLAITRFQRPVAYQGFAESLLPLAAREENPWGLPRRVGGALER